MIQISHEDLIKYVLGIIILLSFIAILGIYLLFLSRIPFGINSNGAGVLLADQSGIANNDVNQRLSNVQSEIDATLTRLQQLEDAKKPVVTTNNTVPAPVAPAYLKISKFSASQTVVPSGSQVSFSYSAINTARGEAFRLLLQCPAGVTATYSNGTNVCRGSIAQALPIDNSGTYSVNLTNNGSESGVIIAVLLASDITDNSIFFRDSRVLTVTVMPSGSNSYNSNAPVTLTSSPNGAIVPATISFTATLNNLQTCQQSHWDFGDGVSSANFPVCPNSFVSNNAKTIFENHVYNQPGNYTATFVAGNNRASNTVYISAQTSLISAPNQYTPVYNPFYTYNVPTQPIYNYTYPIQQPIYTYNYPSLPSVPTVPYNFRAVASGGNSVVLSWAAPTYGNVSSYTIYRKGGNSLDLPIAGSPSTCSSNTVNVCYYSVLGSLTNFTDNNVSPGSTYSYRIVAINGYGTSDYSDNLTVSLAQSNSPTVPRTFTASVNGPQIILNWTAPSAGSVSNYTIYRKTGSSLSVPINSSPSACNNSFSDICYYYVSGQTLALTDFNLLPNTTYTYRIIATNSYGNSDYSDSLTITSGQALPPVSTPTLNPANRVDSISMTQLSWNSVGATYYRVFRSASHNDAAPTNDGLVSGCTSGTTNVCFLVGTGSDQIFSTQAIDNQYDATKTYYYRVKAYSQNGTSNWSNEVTATPSSIVTPPAPVSDAVINSFTVQGQYNPTVSSGAVLNLAYSGSNVAYYKLFLQCPANVSIPDSTTGSNLCRTSQNEAVQISSSGAYQMAIYNMNSANQAVSATLMAFRSNGTLSNSVTRQITVAGSVTPTPTPTPAPDPVITSYTVNGQTSATVASGSAINLAYSGTNVASYKLFLQCPANVSVPDPVTGSNMCRTSQNDAVPISSNGSYQIAIYNMNSGNQTISATLMALRTNGTLSNSITRNISVAPQPGF